MDSYPEYFNTETELEEAISRPTPELINMMETLDGNFIFLGVAGKMGVSMARMANRACEEAGVEKKIIGVSRFSSEEHQIYLEESGIETIKGDLLDQEFINSLPEVKNVVYLAGMKFGTNGNESFTWAMNSYLPGLVAEKFKNSRIVALSTGCVYPLVNVKSGGSVETDTPIPVGEYAQSCLGRERLFEYGSIKNKTEIAIIRLNYSVEMRYGVLVDLATRVNNEVSIDLSMGYATVIWQGDANAMILQSLRVCKSPAKHLNISGAETISVREVATELGKLMNKEIIFTGKEADSALLVNVSESHKVIGKPDVSLQQVIKWTANWISKEKTTLGKPTHFEVRDGKY
ncbi:MAG: hypothetical protein L3J41_04480 [Melioribacteraceae bacterium]|nr:hypothetical protein [Melioribacteraceae bacterium]